MVFVKMKFQVTSLNEYILFMRNVINRNYRITTFKDYHQCNSFDDILYYKFMT